MPAAIRDADVPKFDFDSRTITLSGQTIRLEPRAMQVARLLFERRPQVATRQELLDSVWGTDTGSDEALTQAIAQARKALGDNPAAPRFICTVSKVGYRWLADSAPALPSPPRVDRNVISPLKIAALSALIGALIAAFFILTTRKQVSLEIQRVPAGVPVQSNSG